MDNKEKGKYCKGCAWRHIGIKVDHNHCNYKRGCIREREQRVNGRLLYMDNKLINPSERCYWFWDENSKKKPMIEGFSYKPPKGSYEKCPRIPFRLRK